MTKRVVGPEELQEQFRKHPSYFIEWALSVVPLQGGAPIPFKLNAGQRVVMEKLEEALLLGSYVRMIILKSRRQGISTLGEAIMYWLASCFSNHTTLVLAHDKDTSQELFRIAQGFYDTDARHQAGMMPQVEGASTKALRFGNPDKKNRIGDPGLRSSMLVETAEGRGVGRGLTLQGYHWAEVAYTAKQGVAAGLNIALSKTPGTVGIWESTANGVGDAFERNWLEAVDGRNDFLPVFLPWNIDPNCARPVSKREKEDWKYQAGEEQLQREYGLSFEQLKFRRITIASPECFIAGLPPEDVFRQEYPLCPEEAFLKRGRNFFLMSSVDALRKSVKGAKEPLFRAILKSPPVPSDGSPLVPAIEEKGHGPLVVWEPPIPGEDYVLAGDPSMGVAADSSVAVVLHRKTLTQVAKFKTNTLDPDEFGHFCGLIGWYYNEALIGIERNGPGAAANKALRQMRYNRYWIDRDIVNMDQPIKAFMGWNTQQANKRAMLDRLEEAIRKQEIAIRSHEFYEETRTYILAEVTSQTGTNYSKPTASPGCHDDEIMATAIALQLHLHGGAIRGVKAQPKPDGVDIYAPKMAPDKKSEKKPSFYDWDQWS